MANPAASTTSSQAARRIVLCLDGTWNSDYNEQRRRDGHTVLKPSNVLKVCRAVVPVARDGKVQIAYYDIGVGSLGEYPGRANRLLHRIDRMLGGAWGAGFEGNVEDALHFLAMNYQPGDEVYIFGFSRGAATARAVTQFLQWNHGLPAKADDYYLPIFFRAFVTTRGAPEEWQPLFDRINAEREGDHRDRLNTFNEVPVEYLGVWDTVKALGSRFKATDAEKKFFVGEKPAPCVARARQALAVDERRSDFIPEIWTGSSSNQTMEQRWFAGVHSNVGGGYVHDGLANVAFHWILDGATDVGLEIDPDYVKPFKSWFGDSLYESDSRLYAALDRIRGKRGARSLVGLPPGAHAVLDRSVVLRMTAESVQGADDQPSKTPYRPENVIEFLAEMQDLPAYLRSIDIDALPPDVMRRIEELKRHGHGTPTVRPTAAAHP